MSVLYDDEDDDDEDDDDDDDEDDDARVANDLYYVEVSNGIYESYSFHMDAYGTV